MKFQEPTVKRETLDEIWNQANRLGLTAKDRVSLSEFPVLEEEAQMMLNYLKALPEATSRMPIFEKKWKIIEAMDEKYEGLEQYRAKNKRGHLM